MKNIPIISPLVQLLLGILLSFSLQADDLKVMTWNIEWFPGSRPNASKEEQVKQEEEAAKILERVKPDILLAQEITSEKAFKKLVKTIPGMRLHTITEFPGREFGKRKMPAQQCAIASTLKAHSAWFEEFKPVEDLPSLTRGFAFAALEHPDGGLIMLYSVHLKSNHGSDTPEGEKNIAATRAESARQLIAHKAEMEKRLADQKILGWIIAGDFNSNHDGQFPVCTVIQDMVDAGFHNSWDETPREERLTWRNHPDDTRFEPTTFDYIFTAGFKPTQAKLVSDVPLEASDHAATELILSLEKDE